ALLDRVILGVNAVDASEGLGFLDLAIDAPVVVSVIDLTEARQLLAALVGRLSGLPLRLRKRLAVPAVCPVPHHVIFVVHRYPEMPADLRLSPESRQPPAT